MTKQERVRVATAWAGGAVIGVVVAGVVAVAAESVRVERFCRRFNDWDDR
jgi:uncharacterized protein YfeS